MSLYYSMRIVNDRSGQFSSIQYV